ncbi:MAG: AraC family transcriptional regulator [Desulfovibrio sp.]|jgi:AraC-like DNA-binding protein|nr:AraC family transcriptional regulator [Desulfovibrio sp.]
MENQQDALRRSESGFIEMLLRWAPRDGLNRTSIDGLEIFRRDDTIKVENRVCKPRASLIVQGAKRSVIGTEEYRFGGGYCLVCGVDMPGASHITAATPDEPFLCVTINLDIEMFSKFASEIPESLLSKSREGRGVSLARAEPEVFDAFFRLTSLLDRPERIAALTPLVMQELHYFLFAGPQGDFLRQLSLPRSNNNQIAQAVSWIRNNFSEPLSVEDLAKRFNMSATSLNRHFKRVTTLSPLQYQKKLRLHEAQRLMISECMDANGASLAVGYESPYQFNREYKRQFGLPPHQDVKARRHI